VTPGVRDYAMIGDCHGSALVSADGGIDWACLNRFDADPAFCRILDPDRGGYCHVRPPGQPRRRYVGDTALIETVFDAPKSRVRVLDVMPVWRRPDAGTHDYVTLDAPGWIVRRVQCDRGPVRIPLTFKPSVAFGAQTPLLVAREQSVGTHGCWIYASSALTVDADTARGVLLLDEGQVSWVLIAAEAIDWPVVQKQLPGLVSATVAFWEEWSAYMRYRGPHTRAVRRSAITLKLLTYAPTGAIVAAPTTSLPEAAGGSRNWDYRYCWLRDGTFLLYALSALGYHGEATRFAAFLGEACETRAPRLQIMYGIGHEPELPERTLDYLAGYRDSRPVRVGNGAFEQEQLDVYGEVLDWAHLFEAVGGRLSSGSRQLLRALERTVAERWQEPDAGLWESRGEPRQFVFSKVMAWVAIDRAMRLFGATPDRRRLRNRIRDVVLAEGVDPSRGHLRQAFGASGVDASLLLLPALGFPVPRDVFARTVEAIDRDLAEGDYIYRYAGDEFDGREGAFLICSFWFVDALLFLGERRRAEARFERLLAAASDVGLLSEQIDPASGDLLGNFPQAFSHLAVIQTATLLDLAQRHGHEALRGTHADRARRIVGATAGVTGLWAAFRRTGRVGRLWSSPHSKYRLAGT
jgi:alpha,alpha-trehalase